MRRSGDESGVPQPIRHSLVGDPSASGRTGAEGAAQASGGIPKNSAAGTANRTGGFDSEAEGFEESWQSTCAENGPETLVLTGSTLAVT